MSVLDNHPLLKLDPEKVSEYADIFTEIAVREGGMEHSRVWNAVRQGATPAAGLGLERHHLEAMYAQGFDLLHNGDIERARAVMLTLCQLDPHEGKFMYALAATYQLEGKLDLAAQLYVIFIAMDATNPEGYLRLGECLRGVGEMENAHGSFEIAALEAERGNGRPEAGEYARRMMAELDGTF